MEGWDQARFALNILSLYDPYPTPRIRTEIKYGLEVYRLPIATLILDVAVSFAAGMLFYELVDRIRSDWGSFLS